MEGLVSVLSGRPLRFHFSLHNDGGEPATVPRLFGALGSFVTASVVDADGEVVWESPVVKFKPKLDPADPTSYLALEPGHTLGAVFALDDEPPLAAGDHRLDVAYSNLQYRGTGDHPVGRLEAGASAEFEVVA